MRASFFIGLTIAACCAPSARGAPARKNSPAIGEARRALGRVAAYQEFSADYRLARLGYLTVGDDYYHLFLSRVKETRRWRTLVFANDGDYLGYYETRDAPVELERDGIVFPGRGFDVESGDDEEGVFDSGEARVIRFGADGPPDEAVFPDRVYAFRSSPTRVRPEDPAFRFIRVANRMVDGINRGRYRSIRDELSPEALRRASDERVIEALAAVRERLGRVERIGRPWLKAEDSAVFPLRFDRSLAGLELVLDEEDRILELRVRPREAAFPAAKRNTTALRLPVAGRWRVAEKPRDDFELRACQEAMALVVANRFGKTHRGDGRKNRDHFAYGRPVFAPASGVVVAVIDGVEENRPGAPNPFDRLGNAVMIRHATNEYSVVGFLMEGVGARVGQAVEAGDLIGRCGNSGAAVRPSVHLHLQDAARPLAGSGLRPVFDELYVGDGATANIVARHEPEVGEFVQQRASGLEKGLAAGDFRQTESPGD